MSNFIQGTTQEFDDAIKNRIGYLRNAEKHDHRFNENDKGELERLEALANWYGIGA